MPVQIPVSEKHPRIGPWDVPRAAMMLVAGIGATCVAASAWLLPSALVLPTLSVAAVAGAALVALIAWRRPRNPRSERVTYWDVAGALTLVGVCAALLSDPQAVLPILESRANQ